MLRKSRGRPTSTPPGFILPCRPTVADRPPTGPGWVHGLKHDGYRLQVHIRDGRVKLYTMNGADWSKRYPRIVEEAARIKGHAVIDAEVSVSTVRALHSSSCCITGAMSTTPWHSLSIFWR